MNKKPVVKGFRTAYIDDEVDEKKVDQEISIEESLVELIYARYAPVDSFQESTDQKTTLDLIDEMESTCDVFKSKVKMAMEAKGFKLYYTGSEYVWLLHEWDGILKIGDKVKVNDPGLNELLKFAPPGVPPLNLGWIENFIDTETVMIKFPIGSDDPDNHSQVAPYPKTNILRYQWRRAV